MTMPTGPPRSTLPLLRQWFYKAAYILVAVAIYYVLGGLAPTDVARGILRAVLAFLLVCVAARVFRSAAEPGNGPRPWWRMTGRPRAGFVLGTVSAVLAILWLVDSIGITLSPKLGPTRAQEPVAVALFLLFAALAVLYLTSSVRLRGIERAERIEAERGRKPGSSSAGSSRAGTNR